VPLPICRGRRGGEGRLPAMEGSMTDRRNEREDERERTEKARERRREDEERDRRSDELKESWRRNHPSEKDEKRPKRGRPA
jgi:hypothetical protein